MDLRKEDHEETIFCVERALELDIDRQSLKVKRRTISGKSNRGTWVRIEARPFDKLTGQGWNGIECAEILEGVAKPKWFRAISWMERQPYRAWRADETELIDPQVIKAGGLLLADPQLPESWWTTLNASLDSLAKVASARVASLHSLPLTQTRITDLITKVFPKMIDTFVGEWRVAHADLAWANLTGPECHFLDWEDWGMAPRGFDAATLWLNSLMIPELAERIIRERHADLDTRSGKLAQLFLCAGIIKAGTDYGGLLFTLAQRESERLLTELVLLRNEA